MIHVALVGAGAFGKKHLDGIQRLEGVKCVSLVDAELGRAQEVANQYSVEHIATNLLDVLSSPDIDAVILCTPTPQHAAQAILCMDAGKHVQIEIPLADSLEDAEAVLAKQKETGLIAMCGHTRRFNPSHQWIQQRAKNGLLSIQHLNVQTHFMRRDNENADGEPRTWVDHLLWHHAAHTVDLFSYQTGEPIVQVSAMAGPTHPELGIALDMGIQMKTASGALCTLSLSFNNAGPFGTTFRYICNTGTYIARYDELVDGNNRSINTAGIEPPATGIELQDREFFSAIAGNREPKASVAQVIDCYRVLDDIERQL